MLLRQRRHLHWVVDDERGLHEGTLAELAEYLVDELALAEALVDAFHLQLVHGDVAYLILALAVEVEASLLLDGLQDGQTAVGGLEAHELVANLHFGLAVDGHAYLLKHLLGEAHHPVVVLVWHVELHAGELGVVEAVHALVAEVLANLVHALEAAHDEPLQIELGGDAHVHVDVEGVEVGDEGARRSAAGDALQRWGLHLGVAGRIEDSAHGAQHGGTLDERVLHAVVDDEVDIALAVALLGVVKLVVGHAVLVFHDGQGLDALAQQLERAGVDGNLTRLGFEYETLHTHEVADVEQFLEYLII